MVIQETLLESGGIDSRVFQFAAKFNTCFIDIGNTEKSEAMARLRAESPFFNSVCEGWENFESVESFLSLRTLIVFCLLQELETLVSAECEEPTDGQPGYLMAHFLKHSSLLIMKSVVEVGAQDAAHAAQCSSDSTMMAWDASWSTT